MISTKELISWKTKIEKVRITALIEAQNNKNNPILRDYYAHIGIKADYQLSLIDRLLAQSETNEDCKK